MNVSTLASTPVLLSTGKAIATKSSHDTAETTLDSVAWSSHGEENYKTPQGVFNDFPGRKGYDPNFLGVNLPLPQLDESIRQTAAPLLSDPTQIELKYNHFSVVQNKERATPMMTAVNIDGEQFQDLERKGTWVFDGRIAREYQMSNAAYSDNEFDRGHLVRRKDAQWGPDAAGGSNDTFVYTNCGLQHRDLNQKTWLDVENSVLYGAVATKEKKTVFSGPVLCDDDPVFDNGGKLELPTRIPQAFWKVEVWKDPSEGLQAEAFVISQKDLIGQPGAKIPDEHMTPMQLQTHRVTMEQLEDMTHIHFGGLPDGKDRTESDQAAIVAAGIDLSERPWTKEKPAA